MHFLSLMVLPKPGLRGGCSASQRSPSKRQDFTSECSQDTLLSLTLLHTHTPTHSHLIIYRRQQFPTRLLYTYYIGSYNLQWEKNYKTFFFKKYLTWAPEDSPRSSFISVHINNSALMSELCWPLWMLPITDDHSWNQQVMNHTEGVSSAHTAFLFLM